jgi:PDZ domain-containing secreted protein
MKSSVFTQLLIGACATATIFLPAAATAQRTDESVRVKVHKSQEGHTLQIEEDVPAGDAQDLQQLMNKYGMTDELKELKPGEEVEIVIRRKTTGEETNDVTIEVAPKPTPKVDPKPAFLGVHYEMEFGSTNGSHITKVEPNTPAAKAGLKAGDVITQADGIDLYNLEDLADIIGRKKAGEKVKLTFVRDGKTNTTYVTLAERDEEFFRNNPGGGPSYRIEQLYEESPGSRIWIDDDHVRNNENTNSGPLLGVLMIHTEKRMNVNGTETVEKTDGAMVDDVIGNSAATEIGIKKGDKIVVINGKHVSSATEVTNIIGGMKAGDRVTVEYMRDGQRLSGSGNLKAREGYDLPSLGDSDVQIMRGEVDPGMFDRMHAMMDEARTRATGGNGATTVREFRMVIRMDELSPAEAQSLSAKTGQSIKAESDLDLRGLTLSPNPSTTGKFHVGFDLPTRGFTQIDVMDMNGNVVYCEKLEDFQGRYNKDFDISAESKGIYVMRIVQNGKSFTRKIVTQ